MTIPYDRNASRHRSPSSERPATASIFWLTFSQEDDEQRTQRYARRLFGGAPILSSSTSGNRREPRGLAEPAAMSQHAAR